MVAVVITALLFFLFYTNNLESFTKIQHLGIFLLASIIFISLIGGATQLIGRVIYGELWAIRLMVVISTLWFLISAVIVEPYETDIISNSYENISDFILLGVMPLIIIWGVIWVVKEMIKSKSS